MHRTLGHFIPVGALKTFKRLVPISYAVLRRAREDDLRALAGRLVARLACCLAALAITLSASFTDSSSGNAARMSGSNRTIFVPDR